MIDPSLDLPRWRGELARHSRAQVGPFLQVDAAEALELTWQFMELAVNMPAQDPHPGQAHSSICSNSSSVRFSSSRPRTCEATSTAATRRTTAS